MIVHIVDTLMERNTLMAKCYPRIKDYCREKHGLEFQVSVKHEIILMLRSAFVEELKVGVVSKFSLECHV